MLLTVEVKLDFSIDLFPKINLLNSLTFIMFKENFLI